MVNVVWLGMIFFGILVAAANGNIEVVTKAALDGAGSAVKISMGLIAIITFWLGIMKLAEEAGIISFLSRLVAPLLKFPGIIRPWAPSS
jgi:spore maturation protein A